MKKTLVPPQFYNANVSNKNNQVAELITKLSDSFTRRRSSLAATLCSLLANPYPVDCVAHLSLNTPGYSHSGLYASLSKGRIDYKTLTNSLVGQVQENSEFLNVYTIDSTSWLRPDSPTVPDRSMVHTPKTRSKSEAGWEYSVVAAQNHSSSSASMLPVNVTQVLPTDSRLEVVYQQIKQVCDTSAQHCLFVLDSGYSAHALTLLTREGNLEADVLVRLRSDRVFYLPPKPEPPRVGAPRKHGQRFELKNPSIDPYVTTSFSNRRYGKVEAQAYRFVHPDLQNTHTGMGKTYNEYKIVKPDTPTPIVEAQVIKYQGDKHTKPVWLWYSGKETLDETALKHLVYCYIHRFDIEHMFRFMKQTLGLTSFKPGSTQGALNWFWLQLLTVAVLSISRPVVTNTRLPWEKIVNTAKMTVGRIKRTIVLHVTNLLCSLGVELLKTSGVGTVKGTVFTPRKRHPTLVKGCKTSRSP